MTAAEFRKLALTCPEAEEASHIGHPDFRVRGKIFATLGYPDARHGVLMLTPETQKSLLSDHPGVFIPAKGAWGRRGNTQVLLADAPITTVRSAMTVAWLKVAPKRVAKTFLEGGGRC